MARPEFESRYAFLLRVFLHVNHSVFNDFQKEILELVLDEESGPEEIAEAISRISVIVSKYQLAGWKPERQNGDAVIRPSHYGVFPMEPTYFLVEAGGLNWCLENFVKYVCRYRFKNGTEDLSKAMRNLAMYLRLLDGEPGWSL